MRLSKEKVVWTNKYLVGRVSLVYLLTYFWDVSVKTCWFSYDRESSKIFDCNIKNVNELINFDSLWNYQGTYGFPTISGEIEVNLFASIRVRSEIWRGSLPVGIYMFKVNNRNTRTRCKICFYC